MRTLPRRLGLCSMAAFTACAVSSCGNDDPGSTAGPRQSQSPSAPAASAPPAGRPDPAPLPLAGKDAAAGALTLTQKTPSSATVSWQGVAGTQYFVVQFRPSGQTGWWQSGLLAPTQTSFTQNDLSPGSWQFRLMRYDLDWAMSTGPVIDVPIDSTTSTPGGNGDSFAVTATSADSVTVAWPAVAGAQYYRVQYRAAGTSSWTESALLAPSQTSYTAGGLTAGAWELRRVVYDADWAATITPAVTATVSASAPAAGTVTTTPARALQFMIRPADAFETGTDPAMSAASGMGKGSWVSQGIQPYFGAAAKYWADKCQKTMGSSAYWNWAQPWFLATTTPGTVRGNWRIATRAHRFMVQRKSTNAWQIIQGSSGNANGWADYTSDIGKNSLGAAQYRTASDGSTEWKFPSQSSEIHGGPNGASIAAFEGDIRNIAYTLQVRLVRDDPSLPDDLDGARVVFNVAVDYYPYQGAAMCDGYWPVAGASSFTYATRDWTEHVFFPSASTQNDEKAFRPDDYPSAARLVSDADFLASPPPFTLGQ